MQHGCPAKEPSDIDLDAARHHTLLNSNEAPLDCEISIVASLISNAGARLADLGEEIAQLEDHLKLGADRVGGPNGVRSVLSKAVAHLGGLGEDIELLGYRLEKLSVAPRDDGVLRVASVVDARSAGANEEIERLGDRLKQLRAERVSLSSYRTQNIAILSPLRRMPPEVLAEIFSRTLPSSKERWNRRFRTTESPWLLTHINRHWRAVACSTPSLWFFVNISFRPDIKSVSLSMVETQMMRARGQGLKVYFFGYETSDTLPQIEIFRCLAERSLQWEELFLQLTPHLVPVLEGLRDRVPLLQRLWIQWPTPESQAEVESIDFCQNAPSLVDVATFNEHRFIPFLLPVHQLTRYDIDAPWEIHRAMLKRMPNLAEARIKINFDDQPWPESFEIMDFFFLRRLCVSSPYILDSLRFPALEEIAIDVEEGGGHDILPSLDPAVTRSSCRLRKFPSIVELAIIIDRPADSNELGSLLQTLTIHDVAGSRVVAPHLRCLALAFMDQGQIVSDVYVKMVKSRWKAESNAIESAVVLVKTGSSLDATTINGLKVLGEEGLDFVLLEGVDADHTLDGWLCNSLWG
ncbi:F-box domain-containing protein [Mycena venus]|uniref:F-box domain-containing protein n=1 Tax=Mycena venus TaxID=2733690 RepID=A0A8H6Y618_9AGAR|nr:F-box domain-containing protein [Mycena venus]